MQILYLITRPDRGGAQTNVLSLARQAKARGNEVTVATGGTGWLTEQAAGAGIRTVVFRSLRRSWNPLSTLLFISGMKRELRENPTDIAHFHSSNTLPGILAVWGLKKRPRTVFTVHGLSALHPGWKGPFRAKFVYRLAMRLFLPMFDRVIFVCRHDAEFAERNRLLSGKTGVTIRNGIEQKTDSVSPAAARQTVFRMIGEKDREQTVFGTVGRLDYAKRLEMLLRAARKIRGVSKREFLFIIGGKGPDRQKLERLAEKLGVSDTVRWLGEVRNPETVIPAFRAIILTSRFEGFPYILLEAGLAGVPAIATPVGGVPELVEDGVNGWLAENEDELAEKIVRLAENPEIAVTAGQKLREKVLRDFTEERMVSETMRVYGPPTNPSSLDKLP
ncbi:glycosyltransferase family 4 protein [Candidatus Uhrbacteria bacterium]|nr:glycosyltransferase family 4 protein [Candidatus Uhrbacteria bacterium]